ncbi:uncharacterized protein BJX67DRAFT_149901 [Aspergillus lucknowensis]|uniref:Secreted protein n=1 Tax=Aspergillus lucknowensis TaxID=176173 RepID=A0ABR4LN79_9EURO
MAALPHWEHLPLFFCSSSAASSFFFFLLLLHLPFTTPSYGRPVLFPAGIDLSSIDRNSNQPWTGDLTTVSQPAKCQRLPSCSLCALSPLVYPYLSTLRGRAILLLLVLLIGGDHQCS